MMVRTRGGAAARPESAAEREQRELTMAMKLSLAEAKRGQRGDEGPELAMAMRLSLSDEAEMERAAPQTMHGDQRAAPHAPQRRDVPARPTQQQHEQWRQQWGRSERSRDRVQWGRERQ